MKTSELEKAVGHTFRDPGLLDLALTHSSYANEMHRPGHHNERLEFLGDSVLSLVVSDHLYEVHKRQPEGKLTKTRAGLVCENALYEYSKKIRLGDYLKLGRGEEQSGGRDRPSVCSDAFEALIAAIYLDGGYEAARDFILPYIQQELVALTDYKTQLQEVVQQNPGERLRYVVVGEIGPDHDKRFEVEVHLNSNVIGRGAGRSKKLAEQQAAKEALELMGL